MEQSVADLAYQTIKSKILARTYFPGLQLKEVQISKEIGLTRTPVRSFHQIRTGRSFKNISEQGRFCH